MTEYAAGYMIRRLFTLVSAVSLACTTGCIPVPSPSARADGGRAPRELVGGRGSDRPIRPGATRQQVHDVLGPEDARNLVRFADRRTELLRFRMYEGCGQLVLLAVGCSHVGEVRRADNWYHLL